MDRRLLPSTSGLSALEALDRLGSVTAAADALSLTQSAVSRQLQALEAQLGTPLFERRAKKLSLTPQASQYAAQVRRALDVLGNAAMRLQTNPEGGTLNLAILPTFGMRWLLPRLPRFTRARPDVTVNMTSHLSGVDFSGSDMDAALSFGAGAWPGCAEMLLETEAVVPMASSALLAQHKIRRADDLKRLPLLHIQTRPDAWQNWFEAQGHACGSLPGTRHDQFSTILQAAQLGLGVALLPEYLAREELAEGRLKPAFGEPVPSDGAYYLIWPEGRPKPPALAAFQSWLKDELTRDADDMLPR